MRFYWEELNVKKQAYVAMLAAVTLMVSPLVSESWAAVTLESLSVQMDTMKMEHMKGSLIIQ